MGIVKKSPFDFLRGPQPGARKPAVKSNGKSNEITPIKVEWEI